MSGSTTISTSQSKIETLQLQNSAYGLPIQIVYGVMRVPGNLIWYGGFVAIPHTSSTSGGKGGGVKTQNTTYTYQAAVIMATGEGEIIGIPTIWRGKKVYSGGYTGGNIANASESYTVTGGGGTYTVTQAATYAAASSVTGLIPGGWGFPQSLSEGKDYVRVNGAYTFAAAMAGVAVTIRYQYRSGATSQTGLQALGLSFASGVTGQAAWSYLSTYLPPGGTTGSNSVPYSGIGYVYASAYDLGDGAVVDNHNFEIQAKLAYSVSSSIPDADPAMAAFDLLTNDRYGAMFPSSKLAPNTSWSNYCRAAGLLLSPAIVTQESAANHIAQFARLTNTGVVWSEGVLKLVPYGDAVVTGNGITYTPTNTAVYDLTDDSFIEGDSPIKVSRKPQADAFNHVRLEFLNRSNQYNVEIVEAKDQANIDANGLRSAAVLSAHWIADPVVARNIAQLLLQRALYIRNTYEFKLPWNFAILEPMDLVTLTDSALGYAKLPVRITEIREDADGVLEMVAEDFPSGVGSAPLYVSQVGSGFSHNYNVAPGNVSTPTIFEPPVELTTTGLEVWLAATGTGAYWGGCRVWVSMDGTNYKQIGTLWGGSRYGTLSGAMTNVATSMGVTLNSGVITSGSAADAAAKTTLCFIGGTNKEYVAIQGASLTGTLAYTLSGLNRGLYSTAAAAHSAGDPFVRVDDNIARSGVLDLSFIGKTLYFKLTSFNIYGGAEQSLADVSPFTYLVTGYMAALPPAAPTSATAVPELYGIRVSCARNAEPDVGGYEIRQGAVYATSALLSANGDTSFLWQVQTAGTYTFWVSAVDKLGNKSTPTSVSATMTTPTVSGITTSFANSTLLITWAGAAASFAISEYEVRYGASFAAGTSLGRIRTTTYSEVVKWAGTRTYWIAAYDAAGNVGTAVSVAVVITAPGAVTGTKADVVDNNVLLYWSAPATGTLPIDRYEVRRGASWAAGSVIGSNAASTFTTVFETVAGTFTYWIAAYDTAGTIGTPLSIAATMGQPPDYILRTNFNSALGGTLSNLFLSNGTLIGPVDTTTTWATHFTGNAWASPQDQITAGFPIYIEPGLTTGTYTETYDYGSTIGATTITLTVNSTAVAGTDTVTCQISTSPDNITYTALAAGFSALASTSFRYVKFVVTITGSAGANIIQINQITVKLAMKAKTDNGSGTAAATTGVAVTFNSAFASADTPNVQPNGSTPLIPVVIYAGGANPTGFTVHLYNLAGTDVGGAFSWTVRGY